MTQTTESWYTTWNHLSSQETNCSSGIEAISAFPDQSFLRITNDAEHRPKPADLDKEPWKYLTGQPLQRTKLYTYGLATEGPYVKGNYSCCYKCPPIPFWKQIWFYTQPGHSWDPEIRQYEESDWNLKLREKIKGISVNLASNLAEYRETSTMFVEYAKGVRDIWKFVRGRLPNRRKLNLCDVSGAWLAGVWGLKPLADDLYNSYRKLDEKIAEPLYRKVTTGGEVLDRFNEAGHIGMSRSSDRGTFYVRLTPNGYDFTTGNIAEMGWEVIPFSPLIDWVIPIGSWLSALDALKYVDDVRGTLTRKWFYYHSYFPPYLDGNAPGYSRVRPGKVIHRTHERDVFIGTIPTAPFPSWDPSESWRKVVTAVSLLTSLRGCKPTPAFKVRRKVQTRKGPIWVMSSR